MQFIGRYFLIFLLLFGTRYVYTAEPVPQPKLETIEINDQLQPYPIPLSKKAIIKRHIALYVRYLAVPHLLALSLVGNAWGIKGAVIPQYIAAGIALDQAYDWLKNYRLQNQLSTLCELPIPTSLQSEDILVKHFRSYKQRGEACGWYTVFNASAIQELVQQGTEITAAAIENIVKERWIPYVAAHKEVLAKIIEKASLFTIINQWQKIALAEHVGLSNYYVFSINESGSVLFNGPQRMIGEIELKEQYYYRIFNLKEAATKFKEDKTLVKHILLTVPAEVNSYHAVLLTFINRPGEKPMIIYMDSNNTPLYHCSLQYAVPFFVQKIIGYLLEV